MHKAKKIFKLILYLIISLNSYSQKAIIQGTIKDTKGQTIPYATVCIENFKNCITSDENGFYKIETELNRKIKLIFFQINFDTLIIEIKTNKSIITKDVVLNEQNLQIDVIQAIAENINESGTERINTKNLLALPSLSGNAVETLVKLNMGVSNSNELSSQYNVRGGNFDENLIYVNDIQIYRPFLVRSGQQEGMSFINSDLVSSIQFSAGGFDAQYDDKMSSVLSVKYKIPKKFGANLSLSFLGGSASVENISKNKKFSILLGLRYRQFSYLFSKFSVKGDYKPIFGDFQSYITYKISEKLTFSILTNIAQNSYYFVPKNQSESFGTFNQPLQVNVYYNGQENDSYSTLFSAYTLEYRANKNSFYKLIFSNFYSKEQEKFDIEALYFLNSINKELNSENYGDSLLNFGSGSYLTHARNYLQSQIYSLQLKGGISFFSNKLLWGVKINNEIISDRINEWKYLDSAGYSINFEQNYPQDVIVLFNHISAENYLNTFRTSVFIQNTHTFYNLSNQIKLNTGVRLSHWSYNNEFLISPRGSIIFIPKWKRKWYFRFSSGVYYQSPFYREIRKFDGTLVENPHSQKSIHFVLGGYYSFKLNKRPFKFTTEVYYKKLTDLIPYELDNLRIRYYADQKAKGYAAGIDMKIYGEFVKGVDSWFTLSFLKTEEDIYGDYYYEYLDKNGNPTYNRYEIVDTIIVYPGYIPRPSDRRVSASIFFQDYMPGMEAFKVNLAFYFSTPFPYGPPQTERYRATLRSYPPYLRADLGFSYLILGKNTKKNILKKFNEIWLSLDIFNIFDIRNTASYNWLYLIPNSSNPLPLEYQLIATRNTLTGRLFNLKVSVKF